MKKGKKKKGGKVLKMKRREKKIREGIKKGRKRRGNRWSEKKEKSKKKGMKKKGNKVCVLP